MIDEKPTMVTIILQHDQERLTGKQAAGHFINSFANISTIDVPKDKKNGKKRTSSKNRTTHKMIMRKKN